MLNIWPLSFLTGPFFWRVRMWKIIVGFIVFAGLALYLLNKGGDIDMGGEKHGRFDATGSISFAAQHQHGYQSA